MMNVYEKCPVFENEKYLLRMVEQGDAADLLSVYSDEKSVPIFNSDNCNGDNFHYTTMERMKKQIGFWLMEYENRVYVRWTIIDKDIQSSIGTIECFHRDSNTDYFNNCGLLRLDLRSDYEHKEQILEILNLIIQPAFQLFDCRMIATKIVPTASERREAAVKLGFVVTEEKLIGELLRIYCPFLIRVSSIASLPVICSMLISKHARVLNSRAISFRTASSLL